MRGLFLLAMTLLIGGCSCNRQPDAQASSQAATPESPATKPVDGDPLAQAAQAQAAVTPADSTAQAAATVHAYLAEVAGKNWGKADAYWSGGKPPPRADDFAVRGIDDLRSMRINNGTPKPLDQESPPQAVEIPVILRVRKATGVYEINGWYRLRRKVSGDGWEITSASMQPSMD